MNAPSLSRFKRCTKCGITYPATGDYFQTVNSPKASRSGLTPACRTCNKASYHRWYAANKSKKLAYNKLWKQRDPERHKRLHLEWARLNKDRRNAYRRSLWRENEEYRQREVAASYARSEDAPYTLEALECLPVLRRDPCAYCGKEGGTIDHIEPLAAGGTSDWGNLAGCCLSCNTSKQDTPLLAFLLSRR